MIRDLRPIDELGWDGPLFARKDDLRDGEARRDAGLQRVTENAGDTWLDAVRLAIRALARRRPTLTIEDVRAECELRGVPEPHHPNAWGAVLRGFDGIEPSGRWVKNSIASAHARRVQEWSSLIYEGV